MGNKLFGVDIAGIVKKSVAPGLLDVTLTAYTDGTRTPGSLTGGKNRTSAPVTGIKGVWQDVPRFPRPGFEILVTDKMAMIIGDTIPSGTTIKRNDAITIAGETRYVVALYNVDPANAVYEYLTRDRRGPDGA